MRKLLIGGLVSAGLLAVGCADAKIKIDDINDLNPKGAKNAIFASVTEPADVDGDNVDDFDFTTLLVVASDQDDLCGALEADPDALDNTADIQVVQLAALSVAALGQGADFAEGPVTPNAALLDVIFAPAEGNITITGSVAIRVGGVDKIVAFDEALLAVGDAALDIKKFAAGEQISLDFTTTLTQETADAAFFDTDQDGDGTNDFQAINNPLDVSIRGATFCAALLQ